MIRRVERTAPVSAKRMLLVGGRATCHWCLGLSAPTGPVRCEVCGSRGSVLEWKLKEDERGGM